ncbi:MAG: hypothetical protein CVU42_12520 [Chloroflexi bacterium HGW-Chloroflexi-4]|jgi:hypothetical protein|nr:MAG: hypothetical protein CVU42_12520 [Chloroflexi bacterium HGW-Chloroflexi-4]
MSLSTRDDDIQTQTHTKSRSASWLPLLLFCISAGLLATLWGYNYSSGNAEEQLPFIYRALDPTYLSNDFFTNTFSLYGPRTFFSGFIAFFARFMPLTALLFLLTLIANVAIAFVSARVSNFLFPRSRFSAFLAAVGVLTLKTFWLGYSNIVYRIFLEPEHLALPFILLGFLLILKRSYIPASISFGIASLFHALLGLELGWILFGVVLLELIIQKIRKESQTIKLLPLGIGLILMAAFSATLLYPYTQQPSIPADEFIHLVAYVRHPHHYLPSYFEPWQWGQAAVYLLGFVFTFMLALKRSETLHQHKRLLILIGALLMLLCIGGYLFVEVWPSRLWTSAQMFRLPYLLKWFSIVLLTSWAGELIENPGDKETRFLGISAAVGLVTPLSLAFVPLALWTRKVILPKLKVSEKLLQDTVILLVTLGLVVFYKPEFRTWACFIILFAAVGVITFLKSKKVGLLLGTALPLTLSAIFVLFSTSITPPTFLKYELPVFSLYKTSGEVAEVASFAKANTPTDATFYTPPRMGEFRYLAQRAIVVDFAAYPFQDLSMREWYRRIADCYGVSPLLGFDSLTQLNLTIYRISDEELKSLSERYGFDYAVVYDSTNTNFPIIFRTESLKLIQIQ